MQYQQQLPITSDIEKTHFPLVDVHTQVGRYQKVKPSWILLKQETVSASGISWAICKSAPRSRQITSPAPHNSVFLQAGYPSCRSTNRVKALKGKCRCTCHTQNQICIRMLKIRKPAAHNLSVCSGATWWHSKNAKHGHRTTTTTTTV